MARSIQEAFIDLCRGSAARRSTQPIKDSIAARTKARPTAQRSAPGDKEVDRSHHEKVGAQTTQSAVHEHHAGADTLQGAEWVIEDPGTNIEPLSTATCCGPALRKVSYAKMSCLPKLVRKMLEDYGEHFQDIARNLRERSRKSELKTLLVAGSLRGEGYTSISIALAVALAEQPWHRVLLIDADFSSPQLAEQMGLESEVGFGEILTKNAQIQDALVVLEDPPLHILPLLHRLKEPEKISSSPRLSETMDTLREHYDMIIVDGGSMFVGRGPSPVIAGIDAALIVHQPSVSSKNLLEHLDIYLSAMQISTLGVIQNAVD